METNNPSLHRTQGDSHFDQITGAGSSVSCFTNWGARVDQVWVKGRGDIAGSLFGARPATVDLHPIAGQSAENCTPQLGQPGLWSDRLPHFKMGFTPSSGDELQSEVLLPRGSVHDAIGVVRAFADEMAPHLLVSEIRTIAADSLWMSPQYERATVAFHFTWRPHAAEVMQLVERIEHALAPYEPRPHWGKVFSMNASTIESRYPRHADFLGLIERFDARGAFRNGWLDRCIRRSEPPA
ncbi:MAG: linked oxidase domain protein [Ilumatobacteraceae bacterium]|nr:linked oxidase domain protein [Ilumatobacteraceae bacterium]